MADAERPKCPGCGENHHTHADGDLCFCHNCGEEWWLDTPTEDTHPWLFPGTGVHMNADGVPW